MLRSRALFSLANFVLLKGLNLKGRDDRLGGGLVANETYARFR